jgi:rhodanese-related sulfurtransferase
MTEPASVSVFEAHEKLGAEGHCLLDVRTYAEVQDMRVPGSHAIPLDQLADETHQLSSYTSIHVMCRSGGRSALATNILHSFGMTHAKNVTGGIIAWESAELPVT